jgi:hypothetical protein
MTASAKEVIAAALPGSRRVLQLYDRPGGVPGNRLRAASVEEQADAILAALDAAGFVVVPREPTEAMREAARSAPLARGIGYVGIGEVYCAMIAAQEKE